MTGAQRPYPARESGFTLMELALVLAIGGLMLAVAAGLVRPIIQESRRIETQQKLDNIARAIDYYATVNYRVPCPAVPDTATAAPPFGYQLGSGPAGDWTPPDYCGGNAAQWIGIVPFKTLNIPENWIKDGWGNYITYAISPGFAYDAKGRTTANVHALCRTAEWFTPGEIYDSTTTAISGTAVKPVFLPRNAPKARFCCSYMNIANDLDIHDVNDNPQLAGTRNVSTKANGNIPVDANTADQTWPPLALTGTPPQQTYNVPPNVQVPAADRAEAPVYILVSHGPNGYGAFLGTGIGSRRTTAGATPDELANAGGAPNPPPDTGAWRFYEIPPVDRRSDTLTNEGTFDDVVLWRTQDMMFASQGESCALP